MHRNGPEPERRPPDPTATPPDRPDGPFKVPLGRSPAGALVRAARASARVTYTCPGCGEALVLRRGELRSSHFAHRPGPFCAPETALHRGAKALIARLLRRRSTHRRARLPRLEVPCSGSGPVPGCGHPGPCPGRAWWPLSELPFDEVAEERTTDGGLRPDLLLLHHGVPVLGIEVLVTHAVDARKAARTSYPWVELDAARVLAAPRDWRPCAQAHPWRGLCRDCRWAEQVAAVAYSDHDRPGGYAAELAAARFQARLGPWLEDRSRRGQPRLHWRCPACRARNRRPLRRERLAEAARASALGPPILPEVRIRAADGTVLAIQFGDPDGSGIRAPVTLLPAASLPVLRVRPDGKRPFHLQVVGTNRPWALLCSRCGADGCGTLPPSWLPLPGWASLDPDGPGGTHPEIG